MMRCYRLRLHAYIEYILAANPIVRSAFLMLLISLVTIQYELWAIFVLYWKPAHQYINPDVIIQCIPIVFMITLASLGLYYVCRCFSKRKNSQLQIGIQHIVASFYTIDMLFFGYLIGSMSMAAGAVLLGSPIFGLFLLDSKAVYTALIIGISMIMILCSLSIIGLIQYAPLLKNAVHVESSAFWFISMMFFIIPYWIVVCLLCDMIIKTLRQREKDIRYLAEHDKLTGLWNRHSIDQHAHRMFEPYGRMSALILLDLDHFKRINDQFGHPCGDHVLKIAAKTILQSTRKHDIVGRFGGEEFIVLMEDTVLEEAAAIAERIRTQLSNLTEQHSDGSIIPIRASLGVTATFSGPETQFEHMVSLADQALYKAKAAGRNQVCTANPTFI
jgi:diguanylate cyclase (GGDEF)-like protein